MKKAVLILIILAAQLNAGTILHRSLSEKERAQNEFIWEENIGPFDEMIVSWDALRPSSSYLIQVSAYTSEWSPWVDYAFWGNATQHTFKTTLPGISVYQDALEVLDGGKATGFRVKVSGDLKEFKRLHLSAIDRSDHQILEAAPQDILIDLPVPGISQMALPDVRGERLCSATSISSVVRFLSPSTKVDLITFSDHVWDSAFDIYGNWILNTAQASHELEMSFQCYVCRLNSFQVIIDQLKMGFPVVVSVRGPLKGSASPYASGHLLVVKGYDSKNESVLCMDPAFLKDDLTIVNYPLKDFLEAWNRKLGLAYIFNRIAL